MFAVFGLGQLGKSVAITLAKEGVDVMVVDKNLDRIEEVKDIVTKAYSLDSTDEEELSNLEVESIDTAIVTLGESLEANIITTTLLKKFGVRTVIARASSELQKNILRLVGADMVVTPEIEVGEQIAKGLIYRNMIRSSRIGRGRSLIDVKPPRSFVGKTLKDLDLRARYGITVVAVIKESQSIDEDGKVVTETGFVDVPGGDYLICENDILQIMGPDEQLDEFLEKIRTFD